MEQNVKALLEELIKAHYACVGAAQRAVVSFSSDEFDTDKDAGRWYAAEADFDNVVDKLEAAL